MMFILFGSLFFVAMGMGVYIATLLAADELGLDETMEPRK